MSENKLVGSLVLRTIDIDPTRVCPSSATVGGTPALFDNTYGTIAANGAVVTWKNVNIRTCLGELYRKYNRFNLKVTAAQMRHSSMTAGGTLGDAQFMLFMSGLPFSSGSCYNTRLGPTNQSALCCVNFVTPSSGLGVTTAILGGLVSFEKPLQDVLDITIELKNSNIAAAVDAYTEKPGNPLGQWSIICDIYGIE